MKRIPRKLLLLLTLCFLPTVSLAQGPPIQTDTPIMLGVAGRGARAFLKVVRKETLRRDGDAIADPLNRAVTAYVSPLVLPYNVTTTFQLGAITPLVTRSLTMDAGDESSSGLGDMSIFAKKLLVQVDGKGETFRVAIKGTLKLPTGRQTSALPLGTGSTDYGASLVAGWLKGRLGLYGETIWFLNTSNGDLDYGNRFAYNLALGFRLSPAAYRRYPSPQLNFFLELNGSTVQRSRFGGLENPDSGGDLLFLSPGLQYVGGRKWLVEASLQLPLRDRPNGTQLGTDWTFSTGVRVLLF